MSEEPPAEAPEEGENAEEVPEEEEVLPPPCKYFMYFSVHILDEDKIFEASKYKQT